MASGVTQIADVIVPDHFTKYVQQLTEQKSRLIQSGAVSRDPLMDQQLASNVGGLIFNSPSWQDLDDDADNTSTDEAAGVNDSSPNKVGSALEKSVRLSRNQSWSSADLTAALAGDDPMDVIANRAAKYWRRRLQDVFIATMTGVFADNTAADSGDYTNDIKGASFTDGVTNFSAEAFLDAAITMGDSEDDLGILMVHSLVKNRMQKNNLIDFIPDARGEIMIPTFLGREVITDDSMPQATGIFESWLFGAGALRLGVSSPRVATEIDRKPEAGLGGGQEILFNRVEWMLHPEGHAYDGTAPNGGPTNAATTNNLGAAGSWDRVFSERKQIKVARLITRES